MDLNWRWLLDSDAAIATLIVFAVIYLGAAAGLSFIPANMAKKKGYSFGGFYCLSFFVSFVVTIIIAAVLKDKNPPPPYALPYGPAYPPPYGRPFPYAYPPPYGSYPPYGLPPQPQNTPSAKVCPGCGAALISEDPFCARCGARVK